jgi:serine/threonine-protein kinase
VEDQVAEAQAKIDKGDFATAIDELTPLEKKDPRRADVHAALERAYVGVRNGHESMREAGLWLAADPSAASDVKLEEDVRNAALVRESQEDAFEILESRMGTRGIDLLYDIAYGTSGRQYPQAATRAKRSLELADVRQHASPALSVLLAFREARTCEQKRALLGDARDKGDIRMFAVLQPYEATRGCGFFGRSDCYPCMHKDRELADTLQALQDRAAKPQ